MKVWQVRHEDHLQKWLPAHRQYLSAVRHVLEPQAQWSEPVVKSQVDHPEVVELRK